MTQPAFSGPLDEPDLRDQFRPHPDHLTHLLGRNAAAPARGSRGGQVRKRAPRNPKQLKFQPHLATDVPRESGTDLGGKPELLTLVVAHEKRIDACPIRPESASRIPAGFPASVSASHSSARRAHTRTLGAWRSSLPGRVSAPHRSPPMPSRLVLLRSDDRIRADELREQRPPLLDGFASDVAPFEVSTSKAYNAI